MSTSLSFILAASFILKNILYVCTHNLQLTTFEREMALKSDKMQSLLTARSPKSSLLSPSITPYSVYISLKKQNLAIMIRIPSPTQPSFRWKRKICSACRFLEDLGWLYLYISHFMFACHEWRIGLFRVQRLRKNIHWLICVDTPADYTYKYKFCCKKP